MNLINWILFVIWVGLGLFGWWRAVRDNFRFGDLWLLPGFCLVGPIALFLSVTGPMF